MLKTSSSVKAAIKDFKLFDVTYISNAQNGQIYSNRKWINSCPGRGVWRQRGKQEMIANGAESGG